MTVDIKKSVCLDCIGRETCQRLKRLNPSSGIRDELDVKGYYKKENREEEIFVLVITRCSMKDRYEYAVFKIGRTEKDCDALYYCPLCKKMHRKSSVRGISHISQMSEKQRNAVL